MKRIFGLLLFVLATISCYAGNKARGELRTEINGFQWYCYKGKEAYAINGTKLFRELGDLKSIEFSAADKDDKGMFVVIYKKRGDHNQQISAFTPNGKEIWTSYLYDNKHHPSSFKRMYILFSSPNHKEYYTLFEEREKIMKWEQTIYWLFSTDVNAKKRVIFFYSPSNTAMYNSYSVIGNFFVLKGGKGVMITRYDGEELVKEKEFESVTYNKDANHFICKNNMGYTIINSDGLRLVNSAKDVNYKDNVIEVYNNGTGIITFNGKWIVTPEKGYESYKTERINDRNYYIVKTKGSSQYHLISDDGNDVIGKAYDAIENIAGNIVKVRNNAYYGIVSLDGKEVISTSRGYTYIGNFDTSNRTFAFMKKGYTGVCNERGEEISLTKLPPTADDIKEKGGYASAVELKDGSTKYWKVSKGGHYGLADAEGKMIVPTEMEALELAGTGFLRYKLDGFWGLMDYAGKIIIDTDRGYTSIGDFVTFTKRFPYTMTGFKGECDINGRQISKIKVETPQQTSSSSTSSSMGLTTQQNNGVYPFEYSESNSFYECQMKENKFLSLISSESFRIKISQQKNGNKYLVELYLNSLVTGSAVAKWSNVSPKTTSDGDLCTISMTLSNGETLRIERCMMVDHRRKDLQDTDRIGAIAIMFSPLYAYPSDNNQSSNEREQFVINQLSKYDIKSISYIGSTFSFESAKTATTIDAMLKSISDHR